MAGQAYVKLPNLNLQRWFVPASPRLATNSGSDEQFGTMQFSRRPGGDDDDFDFPDDETQTSDAPAERQRAPRSGGSGGGGRGNGSGGRQRTIQFQPEDRYWTEYLRIALPIIGLILMLGLFWYWASQFIGDDADPNEPVATETVGQVETIAAQPTNEATATTETTVAVTPEDTPEPTTAPTEDAGGDNAGEETPTNEDTTSGDTGSTGEFAPDDVVVVNDAGVRLRSEPSVEGGEATVVTMLSEGDELQILDGPEEAEDYTWYHVLVLDGTGETEGWIADDFISPAE
jgi:hypothetical protein